MSTDFGGPDYGASLVISNGRYVLAGTASGNVGLARYNSDGSLDVSYNDWRLPNMNELASLYDFGQDLLPIDPVFSECSGSPCGYWQAWSSTSSSLYPCIAWVTNENPVDGPPSNKIKTDVFSTRAVRGGL